MTTSILLRFFITSQVWSTRRCGHITNTDKLKLQVIHAESCLPICHPEIRDTHINKHNPMTEKRAYLLSKRWRKRRQSRNGWGYDSRLNRPWNRERPGMAHMQQRGLKLRIGATSIKIDNLFIHKEGEKYKTTHDAVEALYVLFMLVGNTWSIQVITM